jgi:hypothetical protein
MTQRLNVYSTFGHFYIPHVNKGNSTDMNGAEVKPVRTRHTYIHTYPNPDKQHDALLDIKYKHRQQRWQTRHGKYIYTYILLYNNSPQVMFVCYVFI